MNATTEFSAIQYAAATDDVGAELQRVEPWSAITRVPDFLPSAGRIIGLFDTMVGSGSLFRSLKLGGSYRSRPAQPWMSPVENWPKLGWRPRRPAADADLVLKLHRAAAAVIEVKNFSPTMWPLAEPTTIRVGAQIVDRPRVRGRSMVEEFHLLRQMTGRVREVSEHGFSAIFNLDRDPPEGNGNAGPAEVVARFRIDDVLDDRQRAELAPGVLFDLVTGRRVAIDPERGVVVRSRLETSLFLRRPRPLSPVRVADAIRRADAAFAASEQ